MSDRQIEWSAAERAAIERLASATPPEDLETTVLDALHRCGLVEGHTSGRGGTRGESEPRVPVHRRWGWAALALAASLAAFYAGIRVADRGAGSSPAGLRAPSPVAARPERYLLLLYEDGAYRAAATPRERQARVAEYSAWAGEAHAEGTVIDGEELTPAGESRVLDGRGETVVEIGGPPEGPTGVLAGYFLIEAPSDAAAVAMARTLPHLDYGGVVVIRRVVHH